MSTNELVMTLVDLPWGFERFKTNLSI